MKKIRKVWGKKNCKAPVKNPFATNFKQHLAAGVIFAFFFAFMAIF